MSAHSAQSFKVTINKIDFDIIDQNSETDPYEVDGVSRIKWLYSEVQT